MILRLKFPVDCACHKSQSQRSFAGLYMAHKICQVPTASLFAIPETLGILITQTWDLLILLCGTQCSRHQRDSVLRQPLLKCHPVCVFRLSKFPFSVTTPPPCILSLTWEIFYFIIILFFSWREKLRSEICLKGDVFFVCLFVLWQYP